MMHENMPFKKAKTSKYNTVLCMKTKTCVIVVGMSGLMHRLRHCECALWTVCVSNGETMTYLTCDALFLCLFTTENTQCYYHRTFE